MIQNSLEISVNFYGKYNYGIVLQLELGLVFALGSALEQAAKECICIL